MLAEVSGLLKAPTNGYDVAVAVILGLAVIAAAWVFVHGFRRL